MEQIGSKSRVRGELQAGELKLTYGTTTGKQSPDAFVQMALQMAWYKTRGSFSATYETASTRMFLHGRTEVIRTLSEQSRAFVLGMANPKLSVSTLRRFYSA